MAEIDATPSSGRVPAKARFIKPAIKNEMAAINEGPSVPVHLPAPLGSPVTGDCGGAGAISSRFNG